MVVTDYDALDNAIVVRQFQRRHDGQLEMLSRRATVYDEQSAAIRVIDAIFEEPILTADVVHAPDQEFLAAVNAGDVQSATIENHRDANGNMVAVRSAAGGIQRQRFDGQGRWYDQVDAEGRRTFRIFDANGNVARIYAFDPVRDPTSDNFLHHEVFLQGHEYDEFNREVARIDSYGNRWRQHYDTLGNMTASIDPLGNVVRFTHNAFREEVTRMQQRTQTGLGGGAPLPALITQLEYDACGNVVAIVDPLQRRTEFRFDELNRLIESLFAIDPNDPKEVRGYDPAGNLVSITDRNGLVRKMQYDLLNRYIRTDIDASAIASGNELSALSASFASFQYDAGGNLTRHENDYCVVLHV
jgi:YD repeat-containing protein